MYKYTTEPLFIILAEVLLVGTGMSLDEGLQKIDPLRKDLNAWRGYILRVRV